MEAVASGAWLARGQPPGQGFEEAETLADLRQCVDEHLARSQADTIAPPTNSTTESPTLIQPVVRYSFTPSVYRCGETKDGNESRRHTSAPWSEPLVCRPCFTALRLRASRSRRYVHPPQWRPEALQPIPDSLLGPSEHRRQWCFSYNS